MSTPEWREANQNKMREYRREWYARNRTRAKLKVRERQEELSDWWAAYKATQKCAECGEIHPACLEFHHTADDKESSLSHAVMNGWSKERIMKEVAKCVCLCSNCHRKKHWDVSRGRLIFNVGH